MLTAKGLVPTRVCILQNVSLTKHLALSTYVRNLFETMMHMPSTKTIAIVSEGYSTERNLAGDNIVELGTDLYSPLGNLWFTAKAFFSLAKLAKSGHIDVIHCVYPSSSTLAGVAYKMLLSRDTKVVYDIRSPWIEMTLNHLEVGRIVRNTMKSAAYLVERTLLTLVDGVVYITEGLRRYYSARHLPSAKRYTILPSGVDPRVFRCVAKGYLRNLLRLDGSRKLLGYVGGIARTRHLDFLVDAFESLLDDGHEEFALVFIGDGDNRRKLENDVSRRKISGIYFTGSVEQSLIPYMAADLEFGICHLPHSVLFDTSFPLKVLEYLSCGIPVLASDIPAHRELVKELDGLVIYSASTQDFSQKLVGAMSEKPIPKNSQLADYTWTSIVNRLVHFYTSLLCESVCSSAAGNREEQE